MNKPTLVSSDICVHCQALCSRHLFGTIRKKSDNEGQQCAVCPFVDESPTLDTLSLPKYDPFRGPVGALISSQILCISMLQLAMQS